MAIPFEIFEAINYHDFEVVFVTAFDNFIKKAIDHYAFSYIIKPINETKLIDIVKRYLKLQERFYSKKKYKLLSNLLKKTMHVFYYIQVTNTYQ